jgi:sporulation protein YqfC
MRYKRPPGQTESEKDSALRRLAERLDLPPELSGGMARIELSGNRQAIIDGCKGVVEYDGKAVKLSLGKFAVCFTGRDLTIRMLAMEQAVICGMIASIDFL